MIRFSLMLAATLMLAGCSSPMPVPGARQEEHVAASPPAACLPVACAPTVCPVCPTIEVPKPPAKPMQPATWDDLPGWQDADLAASFAAFLDSCRALSRQAAWSAACAAAKTADGNNLRAWFETEFEPWQLTNPDGTHEGLVTGYYEPVLHGSRSRGGVYQIPAFGPPADLITVDLAELYPELKNLKLRGRIEGKKLVPYYSRAEWAGEENRRSGDALLWVDDAVDFFFMQIQGSGQIQLADGGRTRLSYTDQNGYPYRSIGKWLADQGEMKPEQASLQAIRAWAKAHPQRTQEMLNANPSLVFFRELPVEGIGPPGAMGLPLSPELSIAVDARTTPLGAPVWLATTYPSSDQPLRRLMLAQDTGGAIRGVVRADFYWGSGTAAGEQAGRMRQKGQMWVLLPRKEAVKPDPSPQGPS